MEKLFCQTTELLSAHIEKIFNYPKEGIVFYDITPVLQNPVTFKLLIDLLVYRYIPLKIDAVAGIESRGFMIGSALAYQLNTGFITIRKKGKLPRTTISEDYVLEYGQSSIEIHTDAIKPQQRIVLVDDLVATGNTLLAGAKLIQRLGGEVVELASLLEFIDLSGGEKIRSKGLPLYSLCQADGDINKYKDHQ